MLHNCTTWTLFSCFCKEPRREWSVAELSRAINKAHTSVTLHLHRLEEQELIRKTMTKKHTRMFPIFTANSDDKLFLHYKRLHNLDALRPLIEHLADTLQPEAIILFGSYQRGEDIEESDIDLYVPGGEELPLGTFEEELLRPIQLHTSPFETLPPSLQENIINATPLFGFLETKPRPEKSGSPSAGSEGHS